MLEHVPIQIRWAIGAIFAILAVATAIVLFVDRKRDRADGPSELSLRVRTWWIMVIVFSLALVVNRAVSIVFFAFLSFLALKEYLSLIPTRRADRRVLFWAYLAIPIQYFWVYDEWYGLFIIFIPVYVFLFLPMRMVLIGETHDFLRAIGTIFWGLMMMVFSISHMAYLLVLPTRIPTPGGGAALVLYLVFLTEFNDCAQYVWGKSLGRSKVLPTVSPKKTYAGWIGGILTTTALAMMIAPYLTPMRAGAHPWRDPLLAGLIIAMAGFIGDVTISALKRDLGVKDSGTLLPGHGGILDRIDSLTYTAPLFFHFIRYLYGMR